MICDSGPVEDCEWCARLEAMCSCEPPLPVPQEVGRVWTCPDCSMEFHTGRLGDRMPTHPNPDRIAWCGRRT